MKMQLKSLTFLLALTFWCDVTLSLGAEWGYEGPDGPAHWATLSPEFSACAGHNQSPIDLLTVKMIEADLETVHFNYQPVPLDVVNNGHTIQVNYAPGNHITVDGIQFELKQFHFHSPSENRIDNHSYRMEAHLVHADANGHLAVVAVMFDEGAENTFLARIWRHMPKKAGSHVRIAEEKIAVDDLLPPDRNYYRFNGSLTTPPCTEGVRWLVCKHALEASKQQVEAFRTVMEHDNNRPVHPVNARPVLK